MFQSSAAPKDGCYYQLVLAHTMLLYEFQSSAAPKDGCYSQEQVASHAVAPVSILSRPEGRLLPEIGDPLAHP